MLKNIKFRTMLLIALCASSSSLYVMGAENSFNILEKLPTEVMSLHICPYLGKKNIKSLRLTSKTCKNLAQDRWDNPNKLDKVKNYIDFPEGYTAEQISLQLFRCLKNIGTKRKPQCCNTTVDLNNLDHCPIPDCNTFKSGQTLWEHAKFTTKNHSKYNQHNNLIDVVSALSRHMPNFHHSGAHRAAEMLLKSFIGEQHAPDGEINTLTTHIENHGLTDEEKQFLMHVCKKRLQEAKIQDKIIQEMHQKRRQADKEYKENKKHISEEHARHEQEANAQQTQALRAALVPPVGAIPARRNIQASTQRPVAKSFAFANEFAPTPVAALPKSQIIKAQEAEEIEALSTTEEVAALLAGQEAHKRPADSCDGEPDAKKQRGASSSSDTADTADSTSDVTDSTNGATYMSL